MTEHDNFIFNLERKQIRVKEAIKEYKKQWLSGTASTPVKRKTTNSAETLKSKLLGNK